MASSNGSQIFYELNCAGGLCPRESMCEDQTPRRGWFLPPSGPTPPPSLAGPFDSRLQQKKVKRTFLTEGQKRTFRFPMIRLLVNSKGRHRQRPRFYQPVLPGPEVVIIEGNKGGGVELERVCSNGKWRIQLTECLRRSVERTRRVYYWSHDSRVRKVCTG